MDKREMLTPLYFEAGAGLYDSQTFEYGMALLLFLLSEHGLISFSVDEARTIIEGDAKKTLGQVLNIVRKHTDIPPDLDTDIQSALRARNTLIHGYLVQNVERIWDEEERGKLVKEVRAMRKLIRAGDRAVREMTNILFLVYGGGLEAIQESIEREMNLKPPLP